MGREPVGRDRAKDGVKPIRALAAVPDLPAPESAGADVRMSEVVDAELIVGSRVSPELFAVLFDRHAVAIHRYVARRLGTTEADDLLGQTFLLAFERRHRYDETRSDALPWLYGIATNLVHRRRREEIRQYRAYSRTGTDRDHDGLAAEVAARLDAAVTTRALSGVLAELRTAERDVLLLFAWEDLSYPEIAQALDIPIGTVRSRLFRARRALRSALGPAFEEHSDE
jgi:RNA polymerase sigma factor (sigma-70 family)